MTDEERLQELLSQRQWMMEDLASLNNAIADLKSKIN